MNARLLVSLVASTLLTCGAFSAIGAAMTPPPLKIIATVVAHPRAEAHWYAPAYAHGL